MSWALSNPLCMGRMIVRFTAIVEEFESHRVRRTWLQSSILQPSQQVDRLSLEPSRKDAEDIMRMVRSALEDDGQFHAIVEQLPIPIMEGTTDTIPVATEGTVSHRRQSSTPSTSGRSIDDQRRNVCISQPPNFSVVYVGRSNDDHR